MNLIMGKNFYQLLLICSIVSLFSACSKEDTFSTNQGLDFELETLFSDLGGKEQFIIPESNDYANIPQDPNNPITAAKVSLGKLLFYETGLATNPINPQEVGKYSCSSCHVPGAGFQAGIRQGVAEGGMGFGYAGEGRFPNPDYEVNTLDIPPIRVPNNMNVAYVENATWNGRLGATGANVGTENLWVGDEFLETNFLGFEGPETQAIGGLEFHRMEINESFIRSTYYKDLFDLAFPGVLENERYSFLTAGLAIAAFERTMLTNRAPFQQWLKGSTNSMSMEQKEGALLFFDKAGCVDCHKGPALSSNEFHALGMPDLEGEGIVGDFADLEIVHKGRGGFTGVEADNYKYKTPQIYALKHTNFLGHGASFTSIREIIEYKNNAIPQNSIVPNSQLAEQFVPLNLTNDEINKLVDFVENALDDNDMHRFMPESIASGNCFPNNDPQSQIDMGCQ